MKGKSFLQLLVLILLAVGALFSLFTIDTPLFQGNTQLLEVSVILRETDTSAWSTARRGMDQAALDLGVELRVLTLSQEDSMEEQIETLLREIEGGADGIILVPVNPQAMAETLSEVTKHTPVVTLESDMGDSGAVACISVDNQALGTALGEAALEAVPGGGTVLLVDSAPQSTGVTQRLEAARLVLEQGGCVVHSCSTAGFALAEERMDPDVVVAFESKALESSAQVLQWGEGTELLFGMGSTATIASYLERGQIAAVAAQNEFAIGYLAVEQVVSAISNSKTPAVDPLGVTIITKDTMYTEANQKLLFPVTG